MFEPVQAILMLIGLVFTVGCCGAAFMFGVVILCQRMKWTPINFTIQVQDFRRIELWKAADDCRRRAENLRDKIGRA
jgi:hypothetical protein